MINNDVDNYSCSFRKRPLHPDSPDSKTVIPSTLRNVWIRLDPEDTYKISSICSDSLNSYDEIINCNNKNYLITWLILLKMN